MPLVQSSSCDRPTDPRRSLRGGCTAIAIHPAVDHELRPTAQDRVSDERPISEVNRGLSRCKWNLRAAVTQELIGGSFGLNGTSGAWSDRSQHAPVDNMVRMLNIVPSVDHPPMHGVHPAFA